MFLSTALLLMDSTMCLYLNLTARARRTRHQRITTVEALPARTRRPGHAPDILNGRASVSHGMSNSPPDNHTSRRYSSEGLSSKQPDNNKTRGSASQGRSCSPMDNRNGRGCARMASGADRHIITRAAFLAAKDFGAGLHTNTGAGALLAKFSR